MVSHGMKSDVKAYGIFLNEYCMQDWKTKRSSITSEGDGGEGC